MLSVGLAVLCVAPLGAGPNVAWRPLAEGVEYAAWPLAPKPAVADGVLHVVRIDPARARVRAVALSQSGGALRTARQWREELKAVAVINAGMYETDFSTHTGFMRIDQHLNSAGWAKTYHSILLLGAREAGRPAVSILDASAGDGPKSYAGYATVIQNLRLIRAPGTNVWKENGRRWSEAAIAQDRHGRLLFLFARSPLSMRAFNEMLLASPFEIERAMHVEGGPEASLSLKGADLELDLKGSFETGFNENDGNARQWPIPNVICVGGGTP